MREPLDLYIWRVGKFICASYVVSVLYLKVAWEITTVVFNMFGG